MAISGDKTLTPTGTITGTGTQTIGFDWGKSQVREQVTKEYIVTSNDNGVTVSNKLIVTQEFEPLDVDATHTDTNPKTVTMAYEATGANRTFTFKGEANGKFIGCKAPSGSPSNPLAFPNVVCTEYSAGAQNGAVVPLPASVTSERLVEVSNFEGGSTFYDFDLVVPVPDRQQEGTYEIDVQTRDTQGQSVGVTPYEYYRITIQPPIMITTNIIVVYKSSDSTAETVSCDLNWKEGTDSGNGTTLTHNIVTTAGSTSYSHYSFGNAVQTMLLDAATATIKLRAAAAITAVGKTIKNTASVYAYTYSADYAGNHFIEDGDFIADATQLSNINVAANVQSATEYTLNLPTIKQNMGLANSDPLNIYILFDTEAAPVPTGTIVNSSSFSVEVDANDNDYMKGTIGYSFSGRNGTEAANFHIKIFLDYVGVGDEVQFATTGNYVNGVLYEYSGTVAADGAFGSSRGIPAEGIPISSVLTLKYGNNSSDATIMAEVWDLIDSGDLIPTIECTVNNANLTVNGKTYPEIFDTTGADGTAITKVGT